MITRVRRGLDLLYDNQLRVRFKCKKLKGCKLDMTLDDLKRRVQLLQVEAPSYLSKILNGLEKQARSYLAKISVFTWNNISDTGG